MLTYLYAAIIAHSILDIKDGDMMFSGGVPAWIV